MVHVGNRTDITNVEAVLARFWLSRKSSYYEMILGNFFMLFKIKVLFPTISLLSSTWPTPYPGACTTCQWINIIWFVTHYLSITVETQFIFKRAPCFTTVITFIHYGGTRACMAWLVWFWKKESSKGIYYQLGYILLWILHTCFSFWYKISWCLRT